MKVGTLVAVAAVILHLPAMAQDSFEERFAKMEQRIRYLEERVAAQDRVIVEKDRQISSLTSQKDAWFGRMEVGGVVEVEAVYESPGEGKSGTDADVATVELGAAVQVHDWAGAEVVLLYDDDEDLNVDAATLTVGPPDGPWSFTAGQYALPFGTYETSLVSDPVTLEIGETGETALELGFEFDGFVASAFAFNGGLDRGGDDRVSGFGAAAGWAMESEDSAFGVNVSWINDLGESDAIEEAVGEEVSDRRVAGWTASGFASFGAVTVSGEYLAAASEFRDENIAGAEPASWSLEAAYDFEIGGKEATVAASWQQTEDAVLLELPETRWLVGLSVGLADGVALGFEYKRDAGYGEAEGGDGKNSDAFTTLLSAEF